MRVLAACESSGTVRESFRKLGHDAWSCDLLPADDGILFHIQGDALEVITRWKWDLIIACPPCTHLSASGARHWAAKRADGRQQQGIDFFLDVVQACTDSGARWAIENPIGIMSRLYRKPDQIIQPFWFGESARKTTCLWLHNLPLLKPTNMVDEGEWHTTKSGKRLPKWYHDAWGKKDGWKTRSKTFQGISDAMANQWGTYADTNQ